MTSHSSLSGSPVSSLYLSIRSFSPPTNTIQISAEEPGHGQVGRSLLLSLHPPLSQLLLPVQAGDTENNEAPPLCQASAGRSGRHKFLQGFLPLLQDSTASPTLSAYSLKHTYTHIFKRNDLLVRFSIQF